MEKLKVSVDKGLPMLKEMIRLAVIAKEMDMSYSTLDNKMNKRIIRNSPAKFTKRDIFLLNSSIEAIGEKLLLMRIVFEDRESVIEQIQLLSEIVYMPYIYDTVMGKKQHWYYNRMKKVAPKQKKTSFSEDDILHFNMAIIDIANKLLSIEMTL